MKLYSLLLAATLLISLNTTAQAGAKEDLKRLENVINNNVPEKNREPLLSALRKLENSMNDSCSSGSSSLTVYNGICRVSGYSDEVKIGPVKSIEEMAEKCKKMFSNYSTFVGNITTQDLPANTYLNAVCRVNGYSDEVKIGPSKSIDELVSICTNKFSNYRTYLTNIAPIQIN